MPDITGGNTGKESRLNIQKILIIQLASHLFGRFAGKRRGIRAMICKFFINTGRKNVRRAVLIQNICYNKLVYFEILENIAKYYYPAGQCATAVSRKTLYGIKADDGGILWRL